MRKNKRVWQATPPTVAGLEAFWGGASILA